MHRCSRTSPPPATNYGAAARLRNEQLGWSLFRHEDVRRVLLDHETFGNAVSRHRGKSCCGGHGASNGSGTRPRRQAFPANGWAALPLRLG